VAPAAEVGRRSVLITGASSGIGAATAVELAGRGWRIALAGRDRSRLERTADRTGATPEGVLLLETDVTVAASVEASVAALVAAWGNPHALVCAAGDFALALFEKTPESLFRHLLEVNLTGVFLTVRALLPIFYAAGRGHVLAVGSVAAKRPMSGNAAYSASKYGLRGLLEVLHTEAASRGVTVSLVHPGATATPLWERIPAADRAALEVERFLDPRMVAGRIAGLLEAPPASFNELDLF
jgi:NAD(P)-dependent dehydrogenase (short-subunit alcohol dehydrogenase family)